MKTAHPLSEGRIHRGRHPAVRRALALLAAIALASPIAALTVGPAAGGTEVLRESYAPSTWDTSFANVYRNQKDAQSFLARTDFLITRVELYVFDQPGPPPDLLQVSIASDDANQPGATLGATAQQGTQNWTWVPFAFYPWVSLRAGQRYWIVGNDSQSRQRGYEWATNRPGNYSGGEAQWYSPLTGLWTNNTGVDLLFKVYGVSGPSIALEMEPSVRAVDPGALVSFNVHFNNSGNEVANFARLELRFDDGLVYEGDNGSLEGGVLVAPLTWTFNGVAVGAHRMTVWVRVGASSVYYDGKSLQARGYLNYTDSAGRWQTTSADLASVTVVVPVIRAQASPTPIHVAPGETFNFTVSFFDIGSGPARFLWLNASTGPGLTALGDDAASAGGTPTGPLAWLFTNVSAQTYVFNVTVQADAVSEPGRRLPFRMDIEYTDGGGHPFAALSFVSEATIHGPSLVVAALVDRSTLRPGDVYHIVLYLNNTGDENASGTWLNATLPSWTSLEDSQPFAGSSGGGFLRFALQNVTPGPISITLRLRAQTYAPPAASLLLAAALDVANASGTRLRSSSAVASATVVTPQFLPILSSTAGPVRAGDAIDLILGWNNTGNEAAPRLWLNFTLPAKTLLVNASISWSGTNGATFAWVFDDVGLGSRQFGVRLEVSARLATGDNLLAQVAVQYERADGIVLSSGSESIPFQAAAVDAPPALEVLFLWAAILVALLLLFLLLGYMDVLPRRRSSIDDVFLLHNSGILICHYSTTLQPDVDSDIASGMLMAVRNFVADALRSKNGTLQELKYGDYRIELAHGRYAILVVFTRGRQRKGLHQRMAQVLRSIETAYDHVLQAWSGRMEDFKGVEEHLLRLVEA